MKLDIYGNKDDIKSFAYVSPNIILQSITDKLPPLKNKIKMNFLQKFIQYFEYWNYPFKKNVVAMKKIDDKPAVEKQLQIELPPEVQRKHRSISSTMKPLFTNQTITVEEKIFTQKQIQIGKAAGDVRALAIEIIEKKLSNSGINFALTNDPSKSNLSSLPFIASSTVQNSTCFQSKNI